MSRLRASVIAVLIGVLVFCAAGLTALGKFTPRTLFFFVPALLALMFYALRLWKK